jgi:DNA-binding transcriptional MocR family regulator
LHRLLQLASQHGFRLVENNLYADMVADPLPCLASLDHLQQVVYVGSYSKSISPNVRVGYMLANPELMQKLLHLKMRSGLTTSQVMERVVYAAIIDGRWRKHLKRLRQRLAEAHQEVGRHLHRLGFELFIESDEGMYIWTRHRRSGQRRCWMMRWRKASCSGQGSCSWWMPRRPGGCGSMWHSVRSRRCGSCWRRCW